MRQPAFWHNPPEHPGWQAFLLAPVAAIFALLSKRRINSAPDFRADVPVICLGNINIGGTGKTPTAIAVATELTRHNKTVHVVSRGYGGVLTGPVQVNERKHNAAEVGDEPLLLSAFVTTWVSRDRAAGVRAAQAAGADVIVLDDGFQNPSVKRDLNLVVVDAERQFGNRRVIPAGPLREPLDHGLSRTDILCVLGSSASRDDLLGSIDLPGHCRVLGGAIEPLMTGIDWSGMRVFAFAGIGHPEKFFDTLTGLGADVAGRMALDDHQPLGPALLRRLESDAAQVGAQLVTTEKDAVRLPTDMRARVLTLPVRVTIDDWQPFWDACETLGISPG